MGAPFRFVEKTAAGTLTLDCVVTDCEENALLAFRMIAGNMMLDRLKSLPEA